MKEFSQTVRITPKIEQNTPFFKFDYKIENCKYFELNIAYYNEMNLNYSGIPEAVNITGDLELVIEDKSIKG